MRISRRFFKSLFTSSAWWLGVAISLVLHLLVVQIVENKSRAQFEFHADGIRLALQNQVRSYIDVLRGASALFYTADHITRRQFHEYVEKMALKETFPGITNLNVGLRVLRDERTAFEESVRQDTSLNRRGYPDFSIKTKGDPDEHHVLVYLEPLENNLFSFGLDIATNAVVADALAAARDHNSLTASGRLIHIEGPFRHVGLAMRMPLYRYGMPLNTVEERRAAYFGSVGAGFDVRKLILGALNQNMQHYMRLKLYDAESGPAPRPADAPQRLMFDSVQIVGGGAVEDLPPDTEDVFVKKMPIEVGPRTWEAEFIADKSAITQGMDTYLPWLMLIGGILGSGLLYGIYYSMMTARRRAVELANEMTRELRTSESSLAEAQHMAHLGSWTLEPDTGTMTWTAETRRIFGMQSMPDVPDYETFLAHIDENDRKKLRDGLERSIRTGEEFTLEHRITRHDGTSRWVQTISRLGQHERHLLLRGTIMDITDRKHTVEALQRSQDLLRELTAHQDRVKEDERKRIAREIHDELGQTLLALRIDVSMLEARTGKTHPRLNEKVRSALGHIDATVKTIRSIINNLRPAVLDLGLTAAIEWQVTEFRRRTGIGCDLLMSEREFLVDDTRATSLFRILQESLSNVIRHANASHVLIELYQEDGHLVMKITDNGIGLYAENAKNAHSFGLVGVEERVHALQGEFRISSAPGQGTTLTIYIPLATHNAALAPINLIDNPD